MRSVLCFALVLATVGTAAAQAEPDRQTDPARQTDPDRQTDPGLPPGLTPVRPIDPTPSLANRKPPRPNERVNEATALQLSLYGTLASWTVLGLSIAVDQRDGSTTPLAFVGLLGTLLAPSFGHGYAQSFLSRGLGLRVAGLAILMVLIAETARSECEESCGSSRVNTIALGALGLYVVGTLDDIVTAPGAARRYNERLHDLAIVPLIRRDSAGLSLVARF